EAMHLFARTDSNGKFNLHYGLIPGNYSLWAVPPVGMKPPAAEPASARALGWLRTYYPGTADAQAAANIPLSPGGQLLDIEIRLVAAPTHTIRGILFNSDGTPAAKVRVSLHDDDGISRSPKDSLLDQGVHVETKPDGVFEIPAVTDGSYRLSAEIARS